MRINARIYYLARAWISSLLNHKLAAEITANFRSYGWIWTTLMESKTEKSMTLKDFTNITLKVVSEDGIAEYQPTLALLDARHIRVIEGIPEDVPHSEAIQKVVARSGLEKKEFFFGVRSGKGLITTGHYRPGKPTTFMLIQETPDGYSLEKLKNCSWWTVGLQDATANVGPIKPSRIPKSPARSRR